MIKINTKKITASIILVVIGLTLGIGLTYLKADYTDQSTSAPSHNTPAPILMSNVSGDSPFVKFGKLGIYETASSFDANRLGSDALVVEGQTASESLSVSGDAYINSEIPNSGSINYSFVFGNSGETNLWQRDGTTNNKPRLFSVDGYAKTPRIVVGSQNASPTNYNLYLDPATDVSNFASEPWFDGGAYCYLTADDLKNKGCPYDYSIDTSSAYPINNVATYMAQVIPGTGSQVVARCYVLTPYTYSTGQNHNRCY